mmetsp:Transcript_25984/g.40783  ORF Transcript_25984/g.40783 Transcript_25984/m.40783 type:complete len:679 (+) Transcript_25984:188-2224(+)
MRPLNIPSSSMHSATPVRGHPLQYGAPAPASYPYYAMPPHSHVPHPHPPPPPGYALMPIVDQQTMGNPISPDVQGHINSKQHHHQFANHGHSHHGTPSSASRKRTPPRSMSNGATPSRQNKQGSPSPFNPSTGAPSQRVSHPSPPRSAYAPDSHALQTVEGGYAAMPAVTPQRAHSSASLPASKPSPQFANPDKISGARSSPSHRKSPSPTVSAGSGSGSGSSGSGNGSAFPPCLMASNSRFDSSLGILTKKFVFLLKRAASHGFLENGVTIGPKAQGGDGTLDLNVAAEQLGVQKRRIYDITNVLEGIGLIEKRTKNHIAWVHDPRPGKDGSLLSSQDNGERGLEEVSSNIICRGEEKMLMDEVDSLKDEEEKLDTHIAYMMNLVKSYSNSPRGFTVGNKKGNPWMYIRKDDLTSLTDLKDETVIAVRAPAGTTLDVPDPNDGMTPGSRKYQMYFKSPGEKIDVFLIQYGDDKNESKCNGEESHEFGNPSPKRTIFASGTSDRKRQRREGSERPAASGKNHQHVDYYGPSPSNMNPATSSNASYYSNWEQHATLSNSNQKLPGSLEQRDEISEENEGGDYGFGLPPRNRSADGSPRLHREIEATSSNSVVTSSTGNPSPPRSTAVSNSPVKMTKCDSPPGSFDLMDDHFDDALMNADKFFSHPFSQNDDFLDFQPTD